MTESEIGFWIMYLFLSTVNRMDGVMAPTEPADEIRDKGQTAAVARARRALGLCQRCGLRPHDQSGIMCAECWAETGDCDGKTGPCPRCSLRPVGVQGMVCFECYQKEHAGG